MVVQIRREKKKKLEVRSRDLTTKEEITKKECSNIVGNPYSC